MILPPWGEKGGLVSPLKSHIPLLTTEGLGKSSPCCCIWKCSGAGGNNLVPECTWPFHRRAKQATFGAPSSQMRISQQGSKCRKNNGKTTG